MFCRITARTYHNVDMVCQTGGGRSSAMWGDVSVLSATRLRGRLKAVPFFSWSFALGRSLAMQHRPEYQLSSQSPVLTARFHPFDAHVIIGGTYSGQASSPLTCRITLYEPGVYTSKYGLS